MRWTRGRQARKWQSQGEMNLVSGQPACRMIGAFCVRPSRVVLAPVAGVKLAEASQARPGLMSLNPLATVTRRIRRRGEREVRRKTIACGNAG
jgi:hypothetical protein